MSQLSLKKQNLAERIAEQLMHEIEKQGWSAGQRLPAVRDLAQHFKVSANTAHSAVRLLAQRGVVGLRAKGSFVEQVAPTVKTKAQVGIIAVGGHTPYIPPPPADTSRDMGWAIMSGMQADLARVEKLMTIIPSHLFDQDRLVALLDRVDSIRDTLAGVVCFPLGWPRAQQREMLTQLEERGLPYVSLNRLSDLSHHNFVSVDYVGGTRLVGRCLARMRIRNVLLLETTPVTRSHSELDRIGGLYQGYASEGVSGEGIRVLRCENHQMISGYESVKQYLGEHPAPQAVVGMGDFLAEGAMKALSEHGLRIPEDVCVIGGTGLPQAREMTPTLTTLAQPMAELGRQAVQMLLEMERADITRITGRTVRGELVIRQSMVIPETIRKELEDDLETWSFKTEP